MEQTVTSSTTKGILIALILIVIALITFFLNLEKSKLPLLISFIVFIASIIWSVNIYGKQIDYSSTFGNYFAHGFKVAAIVTLFMVVYIFIMIKIFPEIKEQGMEVARQKMESAKMSEELISQNLNMGKKLFTVLAVGQTLILYIVFGAIASLIGAGVTKKNPHPLVD